VKGSSRRPEQVAETLRQVIADALTRGEVRDPRIGFVTLTGVLVTNDLSHARVMVSVPGAEAERTRALQGLQSAAGSADAERHVVELLGVVRVAADGEAGAQLERPPGPGAVQVQPIWRGIQLERATSGGGLLDDRLHVNRVAVATAVHGVSYLIHAAADYRLWAPSADDLIRALSGEKIGKTVALEVLRGTERLTLALVPQERKRTG